MQCLMCPNELVKRKGENATQWQRRKYCSHACSAASQMKDNPTRQVWLKRQRHLKKDHCEQCGKTKADGVRLDLHHVTRVRSDPTGAQTLCASCHSKLHWQEDWSGGRKKVGRKRKSA